MRTVEQLRNVAQDLIASYDARVDAIGAIIDNTYQVLDEFKEKRAKLGAELKETLAKRESLRKTDFDRMINGILLGQEQKEKEVKQNLKNFIKEQKKEAFELKDALTNNEVERMKKAQIGIEKGIAEVKGLLRNFCEQQKGLTEKLRELLTKGKDLKIKDFKDMIRNLSQDAEFASQDAKFAQTLTRRKEVKKMGLSDMATDIKALGQDMASSHVDRKRTIEALQNEVSEMLSNFQNENAQRQEDVNKLLEGFRAENAQRQEEVRDLFKEVQKFMKGVHSENAQQRAETYKLMEGFRREHEQLATAVKEMYSTVARAKGGAKKVSAPSWAEEEEKKPARKAKGKPKKVPSLSTR